MSIYYSCHVTSNNVKYYHEPVVRIRKLVMLRRYEETIDLQEGEASATHIQGLAFPATGEQR